MPARRAYVSGRVQQVGFRFYVQRSAKALGVAGHVCNLADGGVEVYMEGSEGALNELCKLLRVGPKYAVVTKLNVVIVHAQRCCEFTIA